MNDFSAVLRIRIRIRRIRMFLGLLDPQPDSLLRGTDPKILIRIRIRIKMSRIRNTAVQEHGIVDTEYNSSSWTDISSNSSCGSDPSIIKKVKEIPNVKVKNVWNLSLKSLYDCGNKAFHESQSYFQ
jgi:hypothetical protein